ncbi:hypothetical protein RRG08_041035 [Elysia crispata]|uniref:Uncharacterized protein n=1 Tax=Elysia crispata TaxID=231223 RepID=A0AAE0YQY7_9GAST|nr:hypothetical protein RRG08_041035 [Elysia crispata]
MWLFRQCLTLDLVDRSNFWAALTLLLLALITWLFPLTPVFLTLGESQGSDEAGPASVISPSEKERVESLRRYKAHCWCPAEFTQSMVDYSHGICESSFNFIMQGGNASDAPASLHVLALQADNEPAWIETIAEETERYVRPMQQEKEKKRRVSETAQYFLQVTTPLCVFLLSICLIIPYFVWSLLTSLLGGINVDQTLISANEGSKLDHESRRQLHSELFKSTSKEASPWKTSTLYLLLKLLVCIAVVTEAVIVHNSLLPQTRDLRSDGKFDKTTAVNQRSLHRVENSDKLLVCTVKIRILQVVQVFDMQCLFSLVNRFASKKSEVPVVVDTSSETRAQRSTNSQLFMYECLYLITLTILIVLVVTNVTSFLVWLIKLAFRPCEDSHLPLDGYFLLQMAKENAGLDFVTVLSSGEMLQDGTGRDDIELKL